LQHLAAAYGGELVFVLDLVLKSAELALLSPVVERRDEHDHHDGDQYRNAFDPLRLRVGLVVFYFWNDNTKKQRDDM